MKFRKLPVVIDAVQLSWKNWRDVCDLLDAKSAKQEIKTNTVAEFSDPCGETAPFIELTIQTLEGDMTARHGDWIIKGVNGELYPCKPDIFVKTYEPVTIEAFSNRSGTDYVAPVVQQCR